MQSPVPNTLISPRTLDQLEQDLVCLSHRINASEYEFLVLIREFDIRQGWKAWHFNNCAEWLNYKCGLSLGTAREKVRVAIALFDLRKVPGEPYSRPCPRLLGYYYLGPKDLYRK